jgi:hypothetical protein
MPEAPASMQNETRQGPPSARASYTRKSPPSSQHFSTHSISST